MRLRHLPFMCAIAMTSTLTVVESAHAQPAAPSAGDRDTARKLLDEGDSAAAKGDHESALKAYQAAHAIMNLPSTGIEVAKAQAALGQLIEARETALEVARMPAVPREPAVFATARKDAADLAAQLDPRIASLSVKVSGLAAGVVAEVSIDGTPINAAAVGLLRRVDPGAHKIKATAPGYIEATADVIAAEGSSTDVPLEMKADTSKKPLPVVKKPVAKKTHPLSIFVPIGLATTGVGLGVTLGAGIAALKGCLKGKHCPAAIASDVGLGVAVVGAGLTTFGVVLTVKGTEPAVPKEAFVPHRNAAGLSREPATARIQIGLSPLWGGGFLGVTSELQ